jgi:branched-chain amino acid transport system substrate-binding protein
LLARFLAAVVAVFTLLQSSANAQEKLKIGIITTLSAAAGAVPGQQQRNGFELAVKMLGGKLGGREAEIVVADDELKPDVAVAKVKALVDRDRVAFVVGPIFSNILAAIVKPVTDANVFLISPNAGTSSFAGKNCNPNLFVTSYQNDQVHEVLGQYAKESGMKKVISLCRTIRRAKTQPPVSSISSVARFSRRSMCRLANSTIRPS